MVEDRHADALHLASRVKEGDADAQRTFVLRLIKGVRRTVASLLRGDSEVDDAMQLAMIEILGSAPSYRGDASLERWAHRIAARTTLRLLRERRARDRHVDAEVEPAEFAPDAREGDEADSDAIATYLAELSDARRTCIVLRHVHGYSVEEIAELTQKSPNTVKDQLLQGRAQLRKIVRRDVERGA
jgi:RNA polymerase sigma-70 factor (ECF subfamily)